MVWPRCPACGKLMNLSRVKNATVYRCSSCDEVDPMKTEAAKWVQRPWAHRDRERRAGSRILFTRGRDATVSF
jgi:hypothetical protein